MRSSSDHFSASSETRRRRVHHGKDYEEAFRSRGLRPYPRSHAALEGIRNKTSCRRCGSPHNEQSGDDDDVPRV